MHRLTITASEPGQVFRVTDGRAARVGAGMYRMALNLPRGLYSVSAMTGRSVETRAVVLNEDREVAFEQLLASFGHQIFAQAPAVLEALAEFDSPPDATVFIAMRGPFKSKSAITGRPQVFDGRKVILPKGKGHVVGADGCVWAYARYMLPQDSAETLTVTRPVADGGVASHVLPCPAKGLVWCAYPAADPKPIEGAAVPLPHFLRLRLTAHGQVPALETQSLSDVIFTALAGRAPLPFTPDVLNLIFADEADPLQALAAAHIASIALAREGQMAPLSSDSDPTGTDASAIDSWPDGAIPPAQLADQVRDWLLHFGDVRLRSSPDFIALRQIFRLPGDGGVRVSTAPVLLRSLDALLECGDRTDAPLVDDAIWLDRLQVSDTYAYLQWDPEQDAEAVRQELIEQAVSQSDRMGRLLGKAPKPVAVEAMAAPAAALAEPTAAGAMMSMAAAPEAVKAGADSPDLAEGMAAVSDAIKRSAASLRIPTSYLAGFAAKIRNPLR